MKAIICCLLLIFAGSQLWAQDQSAFDAYKVEVFEGPLADPDFETNPDARLFRTRIIETCENEGINFAGHYTVVTFGCGTACQGNYIVNRKTGAISYGLTSELGVKTVAGSNLFIKNIAAQSYSKEERESCSYCNITYWLWQDDSLVEIPKQ